MRYFDLKFTESKEIPEIKERIELQKIHETYWWDILMAHFDYTFVWDITMRHSDETFWWDISIKHFNDTFW